MESRLKDLRIYLSGNCENAQNSGGNWRKEITPRLKALGLIVFDPVNTPGKLSFSNKKDEFELVKKLREEGKFDQLAEYMREVVHTDLRFVDSSDIILVNIDSVKPTTGTTDEVITALNQKKPVYLCSNQGAKTIPLWFFGRMPVRYMYESLEDILKELENIAYCSEEDLKLIDKKRWLFVNKFGI